jgi:hypothetical protein
MYPAPPNRGLQPQQSTPAISNAPEPKGHTPNKATGNIRLQPGLQRALELSRGPHRAVRTGSFVPQGKQWVDAGGAARGDVAGE